MMGSTWRVYGAENRDNSGYYKQLTSSYQCGVGFRLHGEPNGKEGEHETGTGVLQGSLGVLRSLN